MGETVHVSTRAVAILGILVVVVLGGVFTFVVFGLGVGDQTARQVIDDAPLIGDDDIESSGGAVTATTLPAYPEPSQRPILESPDDGLVTFSCDFVEACPLDQFVQYRDPFVVNEVEGRADHAPAPEATFDNPLCTAPEETRPWYREQPQGLTYRCLPGGNPDAAHQMSVVPDSSGYSFTSSSPNLVFEDVERISFEVNMTSVGSRNFWEVAIIPADEAWVDGMPCIPDLPCNDFYDYDDIGSIGFGNQSQEGSGFQIATPDRPDGIAFEATPIELDDGGYRYVECSGDDFCFSPVVHRARTDVRSRYDVVIEVRDDGIWFGQQEEDGAFHWVVAEGVSMPEGPVRVVLKFHGYTPTKGGMGPGFDDNVSASEGGFTWHWDDFEVVAGAAVDSAEYYGDRNPERFTTASAPGCVAFAQGQRDAGNRSVSPVIACPEGTELEGDDEYVVYGPVDDAVINRG